MTKKKKEPNSDMWKRELVDLTYIAVENYEPPEVAPVDPDEDGIDNIDMQLAQLLVFDDENNVEMEEEDDREEEVEEEEEEDMSIA